MSDVLDQIREALGQHLYENKNITLIMARNEIESLRLQLANARKALEDVISHNQMEAWRTIECDPAGNTMALNVVDGPCAVIARAALKDMPK